MWLCRAKPQKESLLSDDRPMRRIRARVHAQNQRYAPVTACSCRPTRACRGSGRDSEVANTGRAAKWECRRRGWWCARKFEGDCWWRSTSARGGGCASLLPARSCWSARRVSKLLPVRAASSPSSSLSVACHHSRHLFCPLASAHWLLRSLLARLPFRPSLASLSARRRLAVVRTMAVAADLVSL